VVLLVLAGCAAPGSPTQEGTGPIDLATDMGLIAVDLTTRQVTLLTDSPGFGWMSTSGTLVAWLDQGFAVLLVSQTGQRQVVPPGQWTRIYDNGTSLELSPTGALWKNISDGTQLGSAPLPPTPRAGSRWNGASDDLTIMAAEYVPENATAPCTNEIFIHGTTNGRTTGCHLRVARDGRVGWTEGGGVRIRAHEGAITNLTPGGGGDISTDNYVSYENPVFTSNSVAYLKLTGGRKLVKTEVIGSDGSTLASLPGPARLAFQDISEDGRFLLLRTFVLK
jgi:hypothetical protein